MAYMRLGDLLISAGTINEEQLEEALGRQKETGERLGDALQSSGIITERQLIDALTVQLGVDYIDLSQVPVTAELSALVPESVAVKYTVVPVREDKDTLYLAMADPLDFVAQEEVRAVSHHKVIPMIATRRACELVIRRLYGSEDTARALQDMRRENLAEEPANMQITAVQSVDDPSAAPTIRFVNSVIERAFDERASDIHLEPQEGEVLVRMRIDGLLQNILTFPSDLHSAVVSRIKIMSGMDITERRLPQDGHASVEVKGHIIDLRISSLPMVYGEKIVIRLLDKSTQNITKESIGLVEPELTLYNNLLRNNSGVILIVGPTGSGKSTTMFAMLSELAREEVNIESLEDPVEYKIPGVSQCQINEAAGMTFASGLRSMLRQDPDIISLGEIRDGETGTIALRAAITGHLVISTLHTNDAVSAIYRLEDLGVERYMVSASLRGIISQRLVRKICPHCRKAYRATAEEKLLLHLNPSEEYTFYKGEGCPECGHRGYYGRTGIFEILEITPEVRACIARGGTNAEILEKARQDGFVSFHENAVEKVLQGITSAEEAMKAINSAEV